MLLKVYLLNNAAQGTHYFPNGALNFLIMYEYSPADKSSAHNLSNMLYLLYNNLLHFFNFLSHRPRNYSLPESLRDCHYMIWDAPSIDIALVTYLLDLVFYIIFLFSWCKTDPSPSELMIYLCSSCRLKLLIQTFTT